MIEVNKALESDLPLILEIENKSFTNPWTESQIKTSINKTYLLKNDGVVKGFICLETVIDELHILHMAVHPNFQRKGFGKKLMEKALSFPANKIFLEVRESNFPAQKLYESFGFKIINKRKNYYQDNNETALVMRMTRE